MSEPAALSSPAEENAQVSAAETRDAQAQGGGSKDGRDAFSSGDATGSRDDSEDATHSSVDGAHVNAAASAAASVAATRARATDVGDSLAACIAKLGRRAKAVRAVLDEQDPRDSTVHICHHTCVAYVKELAPLNEALLALPGGPDAPLPLPAEEGTRWTRDTLGLWNVDAQRLFQRLVRLRSAELDLDLGAAAPPRCEYDVFLAHAGELKNVYVRA